MKKVFIFVFACIFISSCSTAKDTVPVQILAASLGNKINGFENMTEVSTDYIKYCMNSDLSLYSEYIVLYPFSGTEYNEIGIFKVKCEKSIEKGVAEVKNYLLFKKSNWDTRYMEDEFVKIENAEVCTLGKYILYAILNDGERENVIKTFEEILK